MKPLKRLIILLAALALIFIPACHDDVEGEHNTPDSDLTEQAEEFENTDEQASQTESVSPEYDENGNPTGEYLQYLWEQQQKEDAMNSLVEDAMRDQYEEDCETHVFPLD